MQVLDRGTGGVRAVRRAFASTAAQNRPAVIGYLPAGYPDMPTSVNAMLAMVEGGADLVEIGLPGMGVLDGPVVRMANQTALRNGVGLADVVTAIAAVADAGVPAICMAYWAQIERHGIRRFTAAMGRAGCAAVIAPDLPGSEYGEWQTACADNDLGSIGFVSPADDDEKAGRAAMASSAFVYVAGRTGATGHPMLDTGPAYTTVCRVREAASCPVCVGFGISGGARAASVGQFADGVIAGTAFVRLLAAGGPPTVQGFAAELRDAVHSCRSRSLATPLTLSVGRA